jgi:RNA polymerase sigma factor (TIGR02999 family)
MDTPNETGEMGGASTDPPPDDELISKLKRELQSDGRTTVQLVERLHRKLHALASRLLSGESNRSLRTTSLLHDAYVQLEVKPERTWESPAHFYGAAAIAMARILIDKARDRKMERRAPDADPDDRAAAAQVDSTDLIAIGEALEELEVFHPRAAAVASLRFVAGLTMEEIARCLGVSVSSVERDWRYARAELQRRLTIRSDGS